MNDLLFTKELQVREHHHIHSGGTRDNTYTHASGIGNDCLMRVFLTRTEGDVPDESLSDEATQDKFAWGVRLEDEPIRRVLSARPQWSIAKGGVKGRRGLFTLRDDGTGRVSPTFVHDEQCNLGGAIDAILHIPKEHPHKLVYPSGKSVKIYGNIPWELTTIARKTFAGNTPGETLWRLMQNNQDVFNYMLDPEYNMRWLRKKAAQMLVYLYLYNAEVGLLTLLIKSVGRMMTLWVFRDEYTPKIQQLLRYAEMVETDVNLPKHERKIFRTDNWQLCGRCPYFKDYCSEHIKARDVSEAIASNYLIELIERVQVGQALRREMAVEEKEMKKLLQEYLPKDGEADSVALTGGKNLVKVSKSWIEQKTVDDYKAEGRHIVKNGYWRYRTDILDMEGK